MKRSVLTIILIVHVFLVIAQPNSGKPVLDFEAVKNWPRRLGKISLSNNGRYYALERGITGQLNAWLVSDTGQVWHKAVPAKDVQFSYDSKQALYLSNDSLCFLELGTDQIRVIGGVKNVKLLTSENGNEYLCYSLKMPTNELVIVNSQTGKSTHYENVLDYQIDATVKSLIIKTKTNLQWVKLASLESTTIWTTPTNAGSPANSIYFDHSGKQLVFTVQAQEKENGQPTIEIWYYREGMDSAVLKITKRTGGVDKDLLVGNNAKFSANDKWLFFTLEQPKPVFPKHDSGAAMVDVWSYRDIKLQSVQLLQKNDKPRSFWAVTAVKGSGILRLEQENVELVTPPDMVTGDYVVLRKQQPDFWFHSASRAFYLLSCRDGSQRQMKNANVGQCSFSPSGNWFAWFDFTLGYYLDCDVITGTIRNISGTIGKGFSKKQYQDENAGRRPETHGPAGPIAGWQTDEKGIIVYDDYDLWELDPTARLAPNNITQDYGRQHNFKLRLADDKAIVITSDTLLLTAFNPSNKYNGFLQFTLSSHKPPQPLILGPHLYYLVQSQLPGYWPFNNTMPPRKAGRAAVWIVCRQSASEAPNYFISTDLINYRPISRFAPQTAYNWLTASVINFTQLDGTPGQAALYKPENFDSNKKYPVIFLYYEQKSHRLFEFPTPRLTSDEIDIPWFVSQGYLVCAVDISYQLGGPSGKGAGEWAANSVIAAAKYLSLLAFVDGVHMGIQGHSFGGFETNYLATHSHIFAAAAPAAGISDPMSSYLDLRGMFGDNQGYSELGQGRFGATPWERPELYQKNSAVFNADKTTTPMLLMNNKKDGTVPWLQGVELYVALRRLEKKCWLLQYDNGNHVLDLREDAEDYTIRIEQFFDHYLKEAPAPKWMTEGVPAIYKGIEKRYELDPAGSCGKDCKVCKKWNEKYIKDPQATVQEIAAKTVEMHWQ